MYPQTGKIENNAYYNMENIPYYQRFAANTIRYLSIYIRKRNIDRCDRFKPYVEPLVIGKKQSENEKVLIISRLISRCEACWSNKTRAGYIYIYRLIGLCTTGVVVSFFEVLFSSS